MQKLFSYDVVKKIRELINCIDGLSVPRPRALELLKSRTLDAEPETTINLSACIAFECLVLSEACLLHALWVEKKNSHRARIGLSEYLLSSGLIHAIEHAIEQAHLHRVVHVVVVLPPSSAKSVLH